MLRALHTIALAACVVACGAAPATDAQPVSFSAAPAETVTSAGGGLRIEVRWSPATPVRGEDAAELTFLDGNGSAVDGLDVDVVPWMPAHGHGTSVKPDATPAGPGVELVTPVYFYMSGEWQLRMTISGKVDDSAIATVQIP
jgi:hypothetical protein